MTAQAQTSNPSSSALVTLESRYDFPTTVTRLKEALAAHGITLFADIDQSEAAARAGLPLRPTRLILFGNPKAGTPIMQADPHAALELPLRAVVWEGDDKRVHLDYQDVSQTLVGQYQVDPQLVAPLKPVPALLRAAVGQE